MAVLPLPLAGVLIPQEFGGNTIGFSCVVSVSSRRNCYAEGVVPSQEKGCSR